MSTPAAEVLYARCLEIFASLEQAASEIRLLSDEVAGSLVLGASTIPANYFLPDLISQFLRLHPDVAFSLEEGTTSQIIQAVLDGKLCLGVVGAKEELPELHFAPLFEDALVVLASPDKVPKAGCKLTLQEVCAMPWVLRHPGSGTRRAMEKAFEAAGSNPRSLKVASVVDSTEALLRFVRCGMGISVSSRLAAKESLQRHELAILDVPELHFHRSFFVVYHKQRHQFPATQYFLEFVMNAASSIGIQARSAH